MALIWVCASLYPCFFWGTNLGDIFLQSQDKCLTSLHLKQAPLLISSVLLSTVIALTSIVFGSGLGLKLNFLVPFSFFWAGDFPVNWVMVWFQTCHPWWIFMAHLYQSAKFVGVSANITIFCCNPQERVSLKQSIMVVESVILVFVKSDLKQAMCSSMFPDGSLNLISFILAHASAVWSKGLNASKKLVSNTAKVPKSRGTPCFLQLRIACSTNCSFYDAASPSVNSNRTNVIFLLSVLYISLLIAVKMQQSCQNLMRSSLLPENGKGMLSLISLGEAVGVEGEAMLLLEGGLRVSWEKRLRREFGSLGLGLKWKKSDKGLTSPMLFFSVCTLGISSVFVHSFVQCTWDKDQVFIYENTLLLGI